MSSGLSAVIPRDSERFMSRRGGERVARGGRRDGGRGSREDRTAASELSDQEAPREQGGVWTVSRAVESFVVGIVVFWGVRACVTEMWRCWSGRDGDGRRPAVIGCDGQCKGSKCSVGLRGIRNAKSRS